MKFNIPFIKAFVVSVITMQILLYALTWYRLLNAPSLTELDFVSFYTAGRIARKGNYTQLFRLDAQQNVQSPVINADASSNGSQLPKHLPYLHPPYLSPLLAMLALDDYVHSYLMWSFARLLMMIGSSVLIYQFLRGLKWDSESAVLASASCFSFYPLFLALLGGQDTIFSVLALMLWMIGLIKRKEMMAGFGLAFSSLSPTIAGALGVPTLASGRKAGVWFVLGMLMLVIYSLSLIGFQGGRDYISLLERSSQGHGYGLNQSAMYNFLGLLLRSFPNRDANWLRLLAWGGAGICVLFLSFWWYKQERVRIEHIGVTVILSVFTSVHLHIHGLSYLLLPALALMVVFWETGHKKSALMFLPLVSALMFLTTIYLRTSLLYTEAYTMMLVMLLGLLWSLQKGPNPGQLEAYSERG